MAVSHSPAYASEGTYADDNLLASGEGFVSRGDGVVLDGETILRGTVLGKVTASGKLVKSLSAAGDGSETPYAIALEAASPSGADQSNYAYATAGRFSASALDIGTGHTLASIRDALQQKGIHLVDDVASAV